MLFIYECVLRRFSIYFQRVYHWMCPKALVNLAQRLAHWKSSLIWFTIRFQSRPTNVCILNHFPVYLSHRSYHIHQSNITNYIRNVEIVTIFFLDSFLIKLVILIQPIFVNKFDKVADFCEFGKFHFHFWLLIFS